MNVRLLIGRALVAGALLLATGCGKDEVVAPANDGDNTLRSTQINDLGDDALLNGTAKGGGGELNSATLRDGGTGELGDEGEDGGGISDDGDDEADGERNKRSGN